MHIVRDDAALATPRPKAAVPMQAARPNASPGHQWRLLRAGRICDECLAVQVHGEYDDAIACPGR